MKIGIIGAGFVGATAAYALIMRGVGREIVLVDLNHGRAVAEADDLFHAVPFAHPLRVRAGDYEDLENAKVVIMSAGVSQKPGETRLSLLERNAAVFQAVIPKIFTYAPDAVLIVATNPVDVMTHVAAAIAKEYGVPSSRVLGSGTTLDTARYRAMISNYLGVDATHIHGYVIGEHGDSEVLTWSSTYVGNIALAEFCAMNEISLSDSVRAHIDDQTRYAAYHIIEGKGATYYGVGSALARIVSNIVGDRRALMTICTPADEVAGVDNVTVSLPRLVGGDGVLDTYPLSLNFQERKDLQRSATIIREAIDELGF